jgi:hypothetical protein
MALRPPDTASIESRLRLIESSQTDIAAELQALANRVKMMRVRNATNHTSDRDEMNGATLKDRLRMKAGLMAGQVARHRDN